MLARGPLFGPDLYYGDWMPISRLALDDIRGHYICRSPKQFNAANPIGRYRSGNHRSIAGTANSKILSNQLQAASGIAGLGLLSFKARRICARLFLAPAQTQVLQTLQSTEEQFGLLGTQIAAQCDAGPRSPAPPAKGRLEDSCNMGMRVQEGGARTPQTARVSGQISP